MTHACKSFWATAHINPRAGLHSCQQFQSIRNAGLHK